MNIDTGNTAWVLVSAVLVLLMTPGLAFFYGGMTRPKTVLNMVLMSFASMACVSVTWVLWGFGLTFGDSLGGIIGNPTDHIGLASALDADATVDTIPLLAFVAFQAMFAIIATALISGAIADRASFTTWTVFTVAWSSLVYFPVAHWVFAGDGVVSENGGWIVSTLGAVDFAGGTAVHIAAGAAALALVLVIGNRSGFAKNAGKPHNLILVMLGAALLWFGWFGFNAGSALAAGHTASLATVNTLAATGAAMCGWMLTEYLRDRRSTSLGVATGVVAGLVAITPAANSVSPLGALIVGLLGGVGCAFAVGVLHKLGFDDTLDVVGVHLAGGLIGTLAIGLVADPAAPAGAAGVFYGGGVDLLGKQAVGALAVMAYAFVATYALGWVLHRTLGFRVDETAEIHGIDGALHSEQAYDLSEILRSAPSETHDDAAQPAPLIARQRG